MKNLPLYMMAAFYIVAGLNHFVNPLFYVKILPPRLPYPNLIVTVSGVCELIFGLLLPPMVTRPFASWAIILLLIAIFPANGNQLLSYRQTRVVADYLTPSLAVNANLLCLFIYKVLTYLY